MNSITDDVLEAITEAFCAIAWPKGYSDMERNLIRTRISLSYIPEALNKMYTEIVKIAREPNNETCLPPVKK